MRLSQENYRDSQASWTFGLLMLQKLEWLCIAGIFGDSVKKVAFR